MSRTIRRTMMSSGAPRFTSASVPSARRRPAARVGQAASGARVRRQRQRGSRPRRPRRPARPPAADDLLDLHADPHHHRSRPHARGRGRRPADRPGRRRARVDLRAPRRGAPPARASSTSCPSCPSTAPTLADAVRRAVTASPPGRRRARRARASPTATGAHAARGPPPGLRGPPARHRAGGPTRRAGATAVGARPLLVAYNLWLADADLDLARRWPAAVRGAASGPSGSPSATGSRCR